MRIQHKPDDEMEVDWAGGTKNTRYDTLIPRAYKEMADHYNTAIVPARVKHPDDKPNAEGSVKYATTWILAAFCA